MRLLPDQLKVVKPLPHETVAERKAARAWAWRVGHELAAHVWRDGIAGWLAHKPTDAPQPTPAVTDKNTGIVGDNRAGTVTYTGTLHTGYTVALVPVGTAATDMLNAHDVTSAGNGQQESTIRINHTTGPIQPGNYAPDDARTIQAAQIALDTLKATIPGLWAQPPQMNAGAIVVKHGKPGRKPDALYMRAFEMIAEGTPKNEARAWFYKEAGIITPDEKSNNAFDQAMRRRKKRITK